jgi:hypothetical protein
MRTTIPFLFVLALAGTLVWVALQPPRVQGVARERNEAIAALEASQASLEERQAERQRLTDLLTEIARLEAVASDRGLDLSSGIQRYAVSYAESLALPQLAAQLEQTRSSDTRVFVPATVRLERAKKGQGGASHELALDGWAVITSATAPAP